MKIAKNKKRFLVNILLVCVAFFVISSFYSTFKRIGECKDQISLLNEQIEDEKEHNKELRKTKSQIHTDENYKQIARDVLGLVNPGDKVYVNSNQSRD
ncbi:MAG: septum formation initiator family protein [Clostridia bacterium]|nr:septum formation initiator family protein [Clostridia bacterium]